MPSKRHVLVTGANSGLGLGTCQRLIDDFLASHTGSLNIIFTTRSARKGAETLSTLQTYLNRYPGCSRISFQPETVELTTLTTVRELARKLLASDLTHLDAVVCNAGIGGWSGMDWVRCCKDLARDLRVNTTFPKFKIGIVGAVTKRQVGEEPALGEVFCANVFGHYLLVHGLMPLLRACEEPARVIWVSTVAPAGFEFSFDDLQGLSSDVAYESSKRLTDLLALTANQPKSAAFVETFEHVDEQRTVRSRPEMHAFHPGIVVTSVFAMSWVMDIAYLMGILTARLMGGVWSTVHPYSAAHGAVWLALAESEEIRKREDEAQQRDSLTGVKDGRVKWGTAITPLGYTSVKPSDTDGWGIRGTGVAYMKNWWAGKLGRRPGCVEATPETVKTFLADGSKAWQMMEELREEWEGRLLAAEKMTAKQ